MGKCHLNTTIMLWSAAIAFGQQALWEKFAQDGDRLTEAGRYQDAKSFYERALEETQKSSDPVAQAKAWNNLGLLNRLLGNHTDARAQYLCALKLIETAGGPGSPDHAAILQNLAVLDYVAGKLDEAGRQFRRALKIRESAVGENDPATAQTLNSLAAVYVRQKRYAEAERLGTRALKIAAETLGAQDARLVPTLDNLASLYLRQRRLDDALELAERAYSIIRKKYGDDHPYTAQRMNNLALVFINIGRYEGGRTKVRACRLLDSSGKTLMPNCRNSVRVSLRPNHHRFHHIGCPDGT